MPRTPGPDQRPGRPPSLAAYPTYLVAQLAKSSNRALTEALAGQAVTAGHFAVLAAVDDLGSLTQQQLADALDVDKSHMVAVIDHLERLGSVARERDPGDRRCHRIAITDAGRHLVQALHQTDAELQHRLLEPLDPAEREQLTALLGRLVDWHDARRQSAPAGGSPS